MPASGKPLYCSAGSASNTARSLVNAVRWICRTPDQDALGFVLPATAEPEGYLAEKAKGYIKTIPAGGVAQIDMEIGTLAPDKAAEVAARIGEIVES